MRARMLAGLAAACVAASLAFPAPAAAWTTQGGATLAPGQETVEAALGWPGLRIGGRVSLKGGLEIGPYALFTYWDDLLDTRPSLGNSLGCQVKVNFVDEGKFQLALQADPALQVEYWPDQIRLGWQIGIPELLMSYTVTPGLDLDFRFKVPFAMVFDEDYNYEFRLPVLAGFGVEYELSKDLNFFAGFDLGPNFVFSKEEPVCGKVDRFGLQVCDTRKTTGGSRIGATLNVMVGVTYRTK